MATVSSPGIGSGLDVAAIVAKLMAVERQPLTALQTATKKSQDQLSAYGKLQSAMSALRDAARNLTDADTWRATTVASPNTAAVNASSDGSTPAGIYKVNVTRLASAQTLASTHSFAAPTDSVGGGSLTIQLGTWSGSTFTDKPDTAAVTLRFDPPNDTLEDVRDAINASGAGVTASIVSDIDGYRLAMRSTTTGETDGFKVTALDDDGDDGDPAGVSLFAYDPSAGVSQMTLGSAASNSAATINGVAVSSATNEFDKVMDGLSFQFGQVTTTPIDVTVGRDTPGMKKNVTDFADAYNAMVKLIRDQTRYDDSTDTAGVLQADSSALGVLRGLRTLASSSSGAVTTFTRLADIGLEPQSDGSLKINDKKLDAAMGQLADLSGFFSKDDADNALDGFGQTFRTFADLRLGTGGELTTRQEAIQKRIDLNLERADALEARLVLVEKRLTAQYGRLDSSMAQLNSLQSYVTQQIAAWNKSSA